MLHSCISGTHHYQKDHFLHQIVQLQPFFPISFLRMTVPLVLPLYYFIPAHAWQMLGGRAVSWIGTAIVGH